jgi:predicted thioredoxin/glutaredoxin
MDIKLYSSPTCPKCKIIAMKLERKGYSFVKITDEEVILNKGLKSIPWLEVDGELFDFGAANEWINNAPEVI